MAFEGLTEKLSAAFKKLRGKGRLSEADVKEAMKEIRMALLEADVNFKVVKQFVAAVTERAVGADVLESLTPAQMIVKIVNEELTALMGGESTKLTISSRPPTVTSKYRMPITVPRKITVSRARISSGSSHTRLESAAALLNGPAKVPSEPSISRISAPTEYWGARGPSALSWADS